MDDDLLAELTAAEPRSSTPNWFTKLPTDVRSTLCAVRRKWRAMPFCKLRTLLERLQSKFEGMPRDPKRLSEFFRNDRNIYPDVEVADGGREQE